jgi:hypothetical protein
MKKHIGTNKNRPLNNTKHVRWGIRYKLHSIEERDIEKEYIEHAGVHRTLHQIQHTKKSTTYLMRSLRHQTYPVYRIPHQIGYSNRLHNNMRRAITRCMCPV